MRWGLPPGDIWRWPIIDRMDRVAGKINPLLVIVAALLAIIDISCYSALEIGRRRPPQPAVTQTVAPTVPGHSYVLPPVQD